MAESELQQLISSGAISDTTLVWCQGMANWQPLSTVKDRIAGGAVPPVATAAAAAADDTEVCAVSGKRYPRREMMQYEGKWISAEHRDRFFQQLREGVAPTGFSTVPGPFGYGGFWRRFVAQFLDQLILGAVGMIIQIVFALAFGLGTGFGATQSPASPGRAIGYLAVVMCASMAVNFGYHIFFIRKFDATPGKLAMGLKLLRSDGSKLSTARIIGRLLAQIVSSLILMIGYLMAAWDPEKRALHDRMCDTRVIKSRA